MYISVLYLVMSTNKEKQGIKQTDVSNLFCTAGIKAHVVIGVTKNTYEVDPLHPEDNWLYPAFKGFEQLYQKLKKEKKANKIFVTIGTGQGLDAIGAYYILNPTKIIMTDIHPKVIPIAKQNFLQNIGERGVLKGALVGNLCAPLKSMGIVADIIYGNLPNIPFDGISSALDGQLTSTFFDQKKIRVCSNKLEQYLLGLQNDFLHDAYDCLTPGGSIVINLGARVPVGLVEKMFKNAGYEYQELYSMLKVQTQPEWVLGGYTRAEEKYNVLFDFYMFDEAKKTIDKYLGNRSISVEQLKQLLKPFRISAAQGLKRFTYNNERIGHIVQVIRGKKCS